MLIRLVSMAYGNLTSFQGEACHTHPGFVGFVQCQTTSFSGGMGSVDSQLLVGQSG